MKYLLILPNNLGDVIMATPVLEGLKAREGDARITFLAEKGFEAGVANNPFCDRVKLFDRKTLRDLLCGPNWKRGRDGLRDFAQELNKEKFDRIINLAQHPYVSHMVALLDAGTVAGQRYMPEGNHGLADAWSQYLYAIPFARRQNGMHAVDVYRRIAGVRAHNGYSIRLSDSERAFAREYLARQGIDVEAGKLAVVQPGAALAAKRWPEESFVTLGRMLRNQGWQVLVSGAPSERGIARTIQEGLGEGCVCAAGSTSFREAMAIVSFAKACVSGDTALMHAASGLGVQVFALFGATNPVETGPYGDGHWVFSAPCAERPCFRRQCTTMHCMEAVRAETVFSCITRQSPGEKARCDVYRTHLAPGGDYELVAARHDTHGYVNTAGAACTRRLFDPSYELPPMDEGEREECAAECRRFIEIVSSMEKHLTRFLMKQDTRAIGRFESARQTLPSHDTLGGFCTAVLNIRLNSIPLLDPVKGVAASRDICHELREQVAGLAEWVGPRLSYLKPRG